MTISFQTPQQIYELNKLQYTTNTGNSFGLLSQEVNALIYQNAINVALCQQSVKAFLDNMFLSTAYDEQAIILLCQALGIRKKIATPSSGYISIGGTVGAVIPANTEFSNQNGLIYEVVTDGTVANISLNITSITRVGNVVTVITSLPHNLATGNAINISGVTPADFNVISKSIIVINNTMFQYTETGTFGSGSGGSMVVTGNFAKVLIKCQSSGTNSNVSSGETLTINNPVANINNDGYVIYGGIIGGTDIETTESLKNRGLLLQQAPFQTPYSTAYYTNLALDISGIVRAWCIKPPSGIDAGILRIFIEPASTDNIDNLLNAIVDNGKYWPALHPDNIIIAAPIQNSVDIEIDTLSPNTTEMKTILESNLDTFFQNSDINTTYSLDQIKQVVRTSKNSAGIYATFNDLTTTSLAVSYNERLVLGTVSYV